MIDTVLRCAGDQIALAIERAREQKTRVLVTLSGAITAPEDLLGLAQHAGSAMRYRFLWERPVDRFAIAALGATATFSANGMGRFAEIAAACSGILKHSVADAASEAIGAPVFVGGFAFAPDPPKEELWRDFPAALMVLPRLLIVRRDQSATLTVTCIVDERSDCSGILGRLESDLEDMQRSPVCSRPEPSSDPISIRYEAGPTSPLPKWKQAVADTVDDIIHGRLDKLVLARCCTVASNRLFDCERVLRHLRETYPSCVLFWIGTPHGDFLGATPEPLLRVKGRAISTAAIAGSAAPGTSAADARALARTLKNSSKDRVEHAVVVRAIADTLAPLCARLDVPVEPQLLRLDNVQHLITPIAGDLSESHHILDLIDRLHPSPAVAGYPRAVALRLLAQREALDRGWYAGPIGWMDARHDGEFAVAIRSALVRGSEASLYAGAGIVAGSDPEAELGETRLKMQPLLSALLEL
ncbi:MAG: isochorismate synthase MenF [Candidatus Binatia bacterium]